MAMVTDRTESDALLGNEKGLYSYTDLNRVESAVSEIVAQFPPLGVSAQLPVKTDWGLPGDFSAAEWPVASQMARYLGNVAKIKSIFIRWKISHGREQTALKKFWKSQFPELRELSKLIVTAVKYTLGKEPYDG